MAERTLFEQFDERYNHLSFNNIDFRNDQQILELVDRMNQLPEQELGRRKGAVIPVMYRFMKILKQSGDLVSKSQNTLHDNRLKSLMLQDICFVARTGSTCESVIGVLRHRENPEDQVNSKVLLNYLQSFSDKIAETTTLGALYFLIHDKAREFLELEV